jgi:hypothetical protein
MAPAAPWVAVVGDVKTALPPRGVTRARARASRVSPPRPVTSPERAFAPARRCRWYAGWHAAGRVVGQPGAGVTTLGLELAAACTAAGDWAAAVDPAGTLGALAARETGVALERFAVVRRVPPARWASVVAALLEGVTLVLADLPREGVGAADARRQEARARERETVLVVPERWPAESSLTLHAVTSEWAGEDEIHHLAQRQLHVHAEARAGARHGVLARAG